MNVEFDQGQGSGYGYKWWIYNWLIAYTARDSYEQYISIVPDLNMVVIPSAGFYPINFLLLTSILIVSVFVCTTIIFLYFRIRKKKSILKLKEKYLNDVNPDEDN